MDYKKIILLGAFLVFMLAGINVAKAANLSAVTDSISSTTSLVAGDVISALKNQINNLRIALMQLQLSDLKQQLLAALSASSGDTAVEITTDTTADTTTTTTTNTTSSDTTTETTQTTATDTTTATNTNPIPSANNTTTPTTDQINSLVQQVSTLQKELNNLQVPKYTTPTSSSNTASVEPINPTQVPLTPSTPPLPGLPGTCAIVLGAPKCLLGGAGKVLCAQDADCINPNPPPAQGGDSDSVIETVEELQESLNAHGSRVALDGEPGSPGNETSFFGELSRKALCRHQIETFKFNISPNSSVCGRLGPLTQEYFLKIHGETISQEVINAVAVSLIAINAPTDDAKKVEEPEKVNLTITKKLTEKLKIDEVTFSYLIHNETNFKEKDQEITIKIFKDEIQRSYDDPLNLKIKPIKLTKGNKYTISELTDKADNKKYALEEILCGTGIEDKLGRKITVEAKEDMSCLFTNKEIPTVELKIVKNLAKRLFDAQKKETGIEEAGLNGKQAKFAYEIWNYKIIVSNKKNQKKYIEKIADLSILLANGEKSKSSTISLPEGYYDIFEYEVTPDYKVDEKGKVTKGKGKTSDRNFNFLSAECKGSNEVKADFRSSIGNPTINKATVEEVGMTKNTICTFTNEEVKGKVENGKGTLIITKKSPVLREKFNFTITGPMSYNKSLPLTSNTPGMDTKTIKDLQVGTYVIAERPAGVPAVTKDFRNSANYCMKDNVIMPETLTADGKGTLSVKLEEGKVIECVFNNTTTTKATGFLQIIKSVEGDGGEGKTFEFKVDGKSMGEPMPSGSRTAPMVLLPSTVSITEVLPGADWKFSKLNCKSFTPVQYNASKNIEDDVKKIAPILLGGTPTSGKATIQAGKITVCIATNKKVQK